MLRGSSWLAISFLLPLSPYRLELKDVEQALPVFVADRLDCGEVSEGLAHRGAVGTALPQPGRLGHLPEAVDLNPGIRPGKCVVLCKPSLDKILAPLDLDIFHFVLPPIPRNIP